MSNPFADMNPFYSEGPKHKGLTKNVPEFFTAQNFEGGSGFDFGGLSSAYQQPGLNAQTDAMEMYRRQAMGLSPSVANLQMQQGLQANQRAAMSMAGQARGGNIGGAFQGSLGAMSGANAMTAQQGAINRLAEQQAGMAGYAGLGNQLSQFGMGYAGLGQQAYDAFQDRDLNWRLGKRGLDLQERDSNRQFWQSLATAGIGAVGGAVGAAAGS